MRQDWQIEAFRQTVMLAVTAGPIANVPESLGLAHLRDMLKRAEAGHYSRGKLGRHLGWAQCAVVAAGIATLQDMMELNKRCSEAAGSDSDGMSALLADVRAFHQACDVPVLDAPQWAPDDRATLRLRLLGEEYTEALDAYAARSVVDLADALADIIYICVGTALEFGIPLDRVWAEVQRSNMAKVVPETGKARHREDGKILKPEGWTPPDIAGALAS